jgi:hypothetical protein
LLGSTDDFIPSDRVNGGAPGINTRLDSLLPTRVKSELAVDESADSDWLFWIGGPGEGKEVIVEDRIVANEERDSVDNLLFICCHS